MRFAALSLCLFAVACEEKAPTEAQCAFTRVAAPDAAVWSLQDSGPVRDPAPCRDISCLRADAGLIEIAREDGALQEVRSEGKPTVLAPPPLPSSQRHCRTTRAGGGLGYHVIDNATDVWQRTDWVRPPTSPEVLALPPDAYPVASLDGTLCAVATQTTPRNWRVRLVPSGRVVDGAPDHEHPPVRCVDGAAVVERADGSFRFGPDGTEVPLARVSSTRGGSVDTERWVIVGPQSPLRVEGLRGEDAELHLPADRDLSGAQLPAGAARERVTGVGDGARRVLIAERFALPECATLEVLTLIDLETRAATRLRAGDTIFARLSFGLDRFWWVEARPSLVDVTAL